MRKVLSAKNIKFFQLRLKKVKKSKIIKIAKEIRKITKKYKVKLIINDNPNISKITNADGCHLGQKDMKLSDARNLIGKKIKDMELRSIFLQFNKRGFAQFIENLSRVF